MQGVIDMANKPVGINPAIQGAYGRAEDEIKNSYNDPMGSYTTQAVKEKSLRSNLMRMGADKAKAMNEGYFDAENTQFARKAGAAAMTAPQLVSTGGSSLSNTNSQQSGGFWMSVLPGLFQGAGAAAA